jgi:DNA-directed RNA polymerase subunit M/transcription elongation factor TFIIS
MARIEQTARCPHCGGPMKPTSSQVGVIYTCKTCDARDPMDVARRWVAGELQPPSK